MGGGRGAVYARGGRMKRVVAIIAVGLFASACAHENLQKPAAQDDFGVQMAKMNLWREAMFRFKRAVQIDPNDARAHNNLAVAYEAVGDFENARKEYLEALKLDRTKSYIQKNSSRHLNTLSPTPARRHSRRASSPAPAPTSRKTTRATSSSSRGTARGTRRSASSFSGCRSW